MAKLKWLINRWMAMQHPQEDIYRIKQYIQNKIYDPFTKSKFVFNKHHKAYFNNFLKGNYSKKSLEKLLPKEADYLSFKIYDYTISDLRKVKKWNTDLKHNVTPPLGLSHTIPFQNFQLSGDFRYISVLSRLHHFPIYALLSYVYEDASYEEILKKQLKDWSAQNPYLKSINWRSGIEIGIRSVNLIFCRVFTNNKQLAIAIDRQILLNYHFLTRHLSFYSSANNHLLAELMGIFIITCFYENLEGGIEWNNKAYERLLEELFLQTHKDGFTKEQASHYHAEVLGMYSLILAIASQKNRPVEESVFKRLENMATFLKYITNYNGEGVLPIGDSDEGELLYPFFDSKYHIYSSLINDTALILNNHTFLNKTSKFDLRNYLIHGENGLANYQNLIEKAPKENIPLKTKLFPDSGYCFFIENSSRVCFDFGPIGMGKLAAHGHSDILHFSLEYKGFPFIIDPGTFQYHARHTFWRNYFRSVKAHNTISANNLNQASLAGRMIWLNHPQTKLLSFQQNENEVFCEAQHDAYSKKADTIHTRNVSFNRLKKAYRIKDTIEIKAQTTISFALHFNPTLKVVHEKTSIILINANNLRVVLNNNYFSLAKLYRGNESLPFGWYSDRFNKKEPTTSLLLETTLKESTSIETTIHFI